jgi:hypothetical protein
MRNTVQVTRKLQVTRANGLIPGANATNQMFVVSITNRLGFSFWNSYNSNYVSSSGMTVYVRDIVSMSLTNNLGAPPFLLTPYGNPASLIQFAFSTNLSVWPGSSWTTSGTAVPEHQSPDPQSFVSGYWDFAFLPESVFQFSANNFAPIGSSVWDTATTPVPVFPQFGLLTTNRLQAIILDSGHVIDYVQLSGPNGERNISDEIVDKSSNPTEDYQIIAGLAMWDTNGYQNLVTPTRGVVNQINVSKNNPSGTVAAFWIAPPNMPHVFYGPAAEAAYFYGFFVPNFFYNGKVYVNTNLTVQAPYTPTRTAWQYTSWQANDPLVHYLVSDLNTTTRQTGIHHADNAANSDYPKPALNTVGERYQPWGRNQQMSQILSQTVDASKFNHGYRDPLVWGSDYWNFPTSTELPLTSLGRIHRGTPWQTVSLKTTNILTAASNITNQTVNIGLNTWMQWTGDLDAHDAVLSAPINDWHLVEILVQMMNPNDPTHLLSVNNASSTDWVNTLNGVVVLTNITDYPFSSFPPQFNSTVMSADSSQALQIADAVAQVRESQPNQRFETLGDILQTSALTETSPWLDRSITDQLYYGISDEAYEAIPAQLLPLLRPDSVGAIVQTNGEWSLRFSGTDAYRYALQTSTDLIHWEVVSTNYPEQGSFNMPIPQLPDVQKRFYRSRLLPQN